MSFDRPAFTREFLGSNPQVAYALFQAMVMMNIVDPNIITVEYTYISLKKRGLNVLLTPFYLIENYE